MELGKRLRACYRKPDHEFRFVAGSSCLDFLNTLGDRVSEKPNEHLTEYADLVRWLETGDLLSREAGARLVRKSGSDSRAADAVLRRAVALREALYRIFTTIVAGEPPLASDLLLLNEEMADAMVHRRLVASEAGFELAWSGDGDELAEPLWPVALSAAELLTSGSVARIKSCASDSCAWVFMDESRNRSRQWCEMETCGNRAKARRHYAKSRTNR